MRGHLKVGIVCKDVQGITPGGVGRLDEQGLATKRPLPFSGEVLVDADASTLKPTTES
jgi:hypothetical protein